MRAACALDDVCDVFIIGCSLTYVVQPPTMLGCSPYDNSNQDRKVRLRISCSAMKNGSNNVASFDLIWYRRRSCDEIVENLGPGERQDALNTSRTDLTVVNYQSGDSFSEEIPGEYWCQAVIANSTGQYLATESNVLRLLPPENYTGLDVCSTPQSISSSKCAYPLTSFTCAAPCNSKILTPTTCIVSKSTVEENSASIPVMCLS